MSEARLPYALTAYGIPHVLGYLTTRDGAPNPAPLSIVGLMDAAVELNLSAIEIPVDGRDSDAVARLADQLAERSLKVIPDHQTLLDDDIPRLEALLHAAVRLQAPVVRITLSRILCGDRRSFDGGWAAYLETLARRLCAILPIAESLGVAIAIENHQDATSDDLLRLYEKSGSSPAYGITLDAGNPLAVGEGPLEFARRLAPIIKHIHMKDYTIHFAPNGFRLVRCVAGDGVVPFPEILKIVLSNGHPILPGIEIAAQATRTVPLLEDSWWSCYPDRHPSFLIEALRVLWQHGRSADEPYASAWDRGEDSAAVVEEEWNVLRRSVDYFRSL